MGLLGLGLKLKNTLKAKKYLLNQPPKKTKTKVKHYYPPKDFLK